MYYYWVRFENNKSGTIQAEDTEDAKAVAKAVANEYDNPVTIDCIPYPASPILDAAIECPPFCYTPEFCARCLSCPKNPSCVE